MNSLLDEVLPLVQTNLTEKEIASLLILALNYEGIMLDLITISAERTCRSMTGMGGRSMFAVNFNQNALILIEFVYGVESAEEK